MVPTGIVRQKVYDPVQRILHWWIGTTTMSLVALGWLEKLIEVGTLRSSVTQIHIVLGFALAAGFATRLVWGGHWAKARSTECILATRCVETNVSKLQTINAL